MYVSSQRRQPLEQEVTNADNGYVLLFSVHCSAGIIITPMSLRFENHSLKP